jgi:hypothetical protein
MAEYIFHLFHKPHTPFIEELTKIASSLHPPTHPLTSYTWWGLADLGGDFTICMVTPETMTHYPPTNGVENGGFTMRCY